MFVCCCKSKHIQEVPIRQTTNDTPQTATITHRPSTDEEQKALSNISEDEEQGLVLNISNFITLIFEDTLQQIHALQQAPDLQQLFTLKDDEKIISFIQNTFQEHYNNIHQQFNIEKINEFLKVKSQMTNTSPQNLIDERELLGISSNDNHQQNFKHQIEKFIKDISKQEVIKQNIELIENEINKRFHEFKTKILDVIIHEKEDKNKSISTQYKYHPSYKNYIDLFIQYIM